MRRFVRAWFGIAAALCLVAAFVVHTGERVAGASGADTLSTRVIQFHVTGTFAAFDPASGDVVFTFAGPFSGTNVDPATGLVSGAPGPRLGRVENASVRFHFDPSKGPLSSDSARFSCEACRFAFDDGSVLEPMIDDPATLPKEPDIPMEGRLLFELGPVPGGDPSLQRIRGIGCGGAQETAGAGALAGTQGAICVNGTFAFSKDPTGVTDPAELAEITGVGESNCTLVFHVPPLPS